MENLAFRYSDERWLYYQFSLHNLYVSFIEGWENLFELGSERVNMILMDMIILSILINIIIIIIIVIVIVVIIII